MIRIRTKLGRAQEGWSANKERNKPELRFASRNCEFDKLERAQLVARTGVKAVARMAKEFRSRSSRLGI